MLVRKCCVAWYSANDGAASANKHCEIVEALLFQGGRLKSGPAHVRAVTCLTPLHLILSRVTAMLWLKETQGQFCQANHLAHLVSFFKCASQVPVGLDQITMFCFSTPHPCLQLHITHVSLSKVKCIVADAVPLIFRCLTRLAEASIAKPERIYSTSNRQAKLACLIHLLTELGLLPLQQGNV